VGCTTLTRPRAFRIGGSLPAQVNVVFRLRKRKRRSKPCVDCGGDCGPCRVSHKSRLFAAPDVMSHSVDKREAQEKAECAIKFLNEEQ
jgi:hypothetical protein